MKMSLSERQSSSISRASFGPLPDGIGEHGVSSGSLSVRSNLHRSLTLWDVILYGVGCSVGAGIYSLVGIGASKAGPAVSASFFLCGLSCVFTSLSYAEFAARVPVAGSAYTYAYISFGEVVGWLVGWNLTLGYGISAAVVARSWALYLIEFLRSFGVTEDALTLLTQFPLPMFGDSYTCCPLSMVIIGVCTAILVTGAKESTAFNSVMTLINLSVLALVLFSGTVSGTVEIDNLTPYAPNGFGGVAGAAGFVFFAYLGFDMVACLSEEVKDPRRNMPLGILGSLLISISIYVSVSVVVVGMAPISILGDDVPVSNALLANACCTHEEQISSDSNQKCLDMSCAPLVHPFLFYCSRIVSFGAMFGLVTATFCCLMGQPRIFYRMACDGLLFEIFGRVDAKTMTPKAGTIISGIMVALTACLVELEPLADMISLGTLQVFTFVNAGVIYLRLQENDAGSEDLSDHEESPPLLGQLCGNSGKRVPFSTSISSERKSGKPKSIIYVVAFAVSIVIGSIAANHHWNLIVPFCCMIVALVSAALLMVMPKVDPPEYTFQCPLVPIVPLIGIGCNAVMMGSMPLSTWASICLWLVCGSLLYLLYGRRHSKLRRRAKQRRSWLDDEDDETYNTFTT